MKKGDCEISYIPLKRLTTRELQSMSKHDLIMVVIGYEEHYERLKKLQQKLKMIAKDLDDLARFG